MNRNQSNVVRKKILRVFSRVKFTNINQLKDDLDKQDWYKYEIIVFRKTVAKSKVERVFGNIMQFLKILIPSSRRFNLLKYE